MNALTSYNSQSTHRADRLLTRLFPCVQSIVSIDDGRVYGVELLARSTDAFNQVVKPDDFIGLIKESGLMVKLDMYMLTHGINLISKIRHQFANDLIVSVNVSPESLVNDSYRSYLDAQFARAPYLKRFLQLEVTEESMVNSEIISELSSMKDLGVRIAIDDFGSGFSALSCLTKTPCNVVKFDRSLLNRIPDNRSDCEVLSAMIRLCKTLRLDMVCEGVENHAQMNWLMEQGCLVMQGFLFAKPISMKQWLYTQQENRALTEFNEHNWRSSASYLMASNEIRL